MIHWNNFSITKQNKNTEFGFKKLCHIHFLKDFYWPRQTGIKNSDEIYLIWKISVLKRLMMWKIMCFLVIFCDFLVRIRQKVQLWFWIVDCVIFFNFYIDVPVQLFHVFFKVDWTGLIIRQIEKDKQFSKRKYKFNEVYE